MEDMVLSYNLQFFAKDGPGGERTEPATHKKLADARKKGQVAHSKEIGTVVGMLAMFIIIKVYAGTLGSSLMGLFEVFYGQMPALIKNIDGNVPIASMVYFVNTGMLRVLILVLPFMISAFVIGIVCDIVQVKWKPTTKPLKPKFSKLNPINGIKRLFSITSLVELAKALLKMGIVGYVVYAYMKGIVGELYMLYDISVKQSIVMIGDIVVDLGIRVSAVYVVIAALDYIYQKWKFKEDMKMTKQEVKDEFKNQEGDPKVKSQQRRRMMEASMRRMMQELPTADVVITNPTHYAVAIKYDRDGKLPAPVVIAKGADYLAQKIKDVARDNDIYITEDKPLARMLYATVEVGQMIPPELYEPVANVLAFVYKLKGKI